MSQYFRKGADIRVASSPADEVALRFKGFMPLVPEIVEPEIVEPEVSKPVLFTSTARSPEEASPIIKAGKDKA